MASGDMVNGGVYICSSFSVVAIKGVLVCPFTKVIHSFHTWRIIRGKEPKSTTAWTEGCGFGDKGAVHSENTPRAHSSAPGDVLECVAGCTRVRPRAYSNAAAVHPDFSAEKSGRFGGRAARAAAGAQRKRRAQRAMRSLRPSSGRSRGGATCRRTRRGGAICAWRRSWARTWCRTRRSRSAPPCNTFRPGRGRG